MSRSKPNKEPAKKKMTASQLANLRPAKKGEPSRNPEGSRLHNPLTRALTQVSKEAYCKALSVAFKGKEGELQELVDNPETPMLEKFVAKSMLHAFETGQFGFVERIADRLLGTVGETMTINQTSNVSTTNQIAVISDSDLKARIMKLREDV